MSISSHTLKRLVVRALGGETSRATALVRSALGRTSVPDASSGSAGAVQSANAPVSNAGAAQAQLVANARVVFSHGQLPTNFTINLGVAPCNHSCLFCPQSVTKPKKAKWLDLELLRKVLLEMPEENVMLNISSYSETLAAPNLAPSVRLMKELRPKLPIVMATNGSLFREKVIEEVLAAGLDYYQYSLDAPTAESYARLIQRDEFETVVNNLRKVVAIRDRVSPSTRIQSHLMEFRETTAENKVAIARIKALLGDNDIVAERKVANWGGGPWGLEARLAKAGFTPVYQTPATRYPCNAIFMAFDLSPHGGYHPCVAAVPDSIEADELHDVPSLGHASEITWSEAWARLKDMRTAHLQGRWDDFDCCKTCNIWGLWDNLWVDRGPGAGPGTRFSLVGDVDHVGREARVAE